MSKQTYSNEPHWFAVHTYSGYENAVERNLKQRIESFGMQDKIFDVIVPKEKKIKIRGGKKVEVDEKVYPGYVLVKMIATDDAWSVVRNTPQVSGGFVGTANQAVPLGDDETKRIFDRMESGVTKHTIDLMIDDTVLIINGPFKDLEGRVGEVDENRGKIKVMVPMFGRETPVELDADQVQRI